VLQQLLSLYVIPLEDELIVGMLGTSLDSKMPFICILAVRLLLMWPDLKDSFERFLC